MIACCFIGVKLCVGINLGWRCWLEMPMSVAHLCIFTHLNWNGALVVALHKLTPKMLVH